MHNLWTFFSIYNSLSWILNKYLQLNMRLLTFMCLSLAHELGILVKVCRRPTKGVEDLQSFDAEAVVEAIFG
jgi:hypothetical protein